MFWPLHMWVLLSSGESQAGVQLSLLIRKEVHLGHHSNALLIQIREAIRMIVTQLMDMPYILATMSFHGQLRNKLQLPILLLRLSTSPLPMLQLKFFGWNHPLRRMKLHFKSLQPCSAITLELLTLLPILYFIPNETHWGRLSLYKRIITS